MRTLNKVVVTTVKNSKTGVESFIHISEKNPNYASVFLTYRQNIVTINEETGSSFSKITTKTAWIQGETNTLKQMYTHSGQILEGKIIRLYSFEPFYGKQEPVANPETGEIKLKDGKPFYFRDVYDQSGTLEDKWIIKNSNPQTVETVEFE